MKIKLTAGFIVAFISLHFIMHEAHELAHTIAGRMICGCWGERDFNIWNLCKGCYEQNSLAVFTKFAGPLFTFSMIWMGVYFLKANRSVQQRSFGLVLIFANIPFARIFTASIGHGDEISGLNSLLNDHTLAWITGLGLVLLLTVYPLYKAFGTIANKSRIGYFILFLLAPMIIDLVFVFGLMNTLLKKELLSNYWILGSPLLVTVFNFINLIVFLFTRKNIYKLSNTANG